MIKQLSLAGIPNNIIKRFSAIDGTNECFSEGQLALFKSAEFMHKDFLKPFAFKIIGNQLSHFSIYKDVIANNYANVLILQDDVIFCDEFLSKFNHVCESLPTDCEVLNIGLHEYANLHNFVAYNLKSETEYKGIEQEKITESICKLKNTTQPCSLAYVLTQKGAQNIVAHFEQHGFPYATDIALNHYLIKKNIFYGSRRILCTGDPSFGSDIFHPR
jgi:GR25 family glycosyltransferase involved in LPS biosynthesis